MKNTQWLIAGACALPVLASAQELTDWASPRGQLGVSVPFWFNAHARFTGVRANNPGPLTGGTVNRTYDDGYSRVDATGNAPVGGLPSTSYFGYASDAQVVNVVGAGTLALHSQSLNGGDYTRKVDNRPEFPGLELHYRHDLTGDKSWRLGWEAGAGYSYFKWHQNGAPNATVDLITHIFDLGGVNLAPGAAPYSGPSVALPGSPVIGSTPNGTSSQTTVAASVTGPRQLELHTLLLRLGPTLEWQPAARWSLGVQGGLLVGAGWSQLSYAEQITVATANIAPISQSGRSNDSHLWGGFYGAARINYQFNQHWDANVEVRRLWQDQQNHHGPARSAEINLGDAIGLTAGVNYRF